MLKEQTAATSQALMNAMKESSVDKVTITSEHTVLTIEDGAKV